MKHNWIILHTYYSYNYAKEHNYHQIQTGE